MQASMFNVRVPLPDRQEVFLMNTFTDAQLVVSNEVATLLDSFEPNDWSTEPAPAPEPRTLTPGEQTALDTLSQHGFLVTDRAAERAALDHFFSTFRDDTSQLRLTVLTTLQCNFACDYCIQGDHGDYNRTAHKMSLETAADVASWAERELDRLAPESLVLTFFGGEPLLNLPVVYLLAERLHAAAAARGVRMLVNVITNGLLLTREVVQRLKPLGLNGVKITLDGDRATHDRMRPLRGGQGTFDRIIANIRAVAGECRIAIGGNFDADSLDSYPALLDFLAAQDFAPALTRVAFKPVIRAPQPLSVGSGSAKADPSGSLAPQTIAGRRILPLTPVANDGKPLGGACMTATGAGTGARSSAASACDSCHFVDDQMSFLREETRRRGFPTLDGVHMGPCEIHRRHAHTIGPDGARYACPGFSGEAQQAVGHILTDRETPAQAEAAARFETLAAWRKCGDCSFIPVCGGGCSVASHTEHGDMHTPTCHRRSFESALITLAADAAGVCA
jgi:uncharacterized protein